MTRSNEVQAPVPEIGILGTGRMGVRLAAMFARAGRQVVLGSRDPARAAELTARLNIGQLRPGSYDEALAAPARPARDLHPRRPARSAGGPVATGSAASC